MSRAPSTQPPTPPRLAVRIGALSLPGETQARAERIGAALRTELAVLLAAAPLPPNLTQSAARGRLEMGTLRISAHERPEVLGRRLARLIARALLEPSRGEVAR